jgi:TP901 family phage tail tape measure protein
MSEEELGALVVRIEANTAQLQSGIAQASQSVGSFGSKLGGAAKLLAGAFAVKKVADFGKAVVDMASSFEDGMANVSTLLQGDVSNRIEELGDNIQQLQVQTGQTAETLTDGLYQVISAFGDTAASAEILETATKAAAAGGAAVADSVNLISAVTKGFGDTSAEAAQKASDLAFETVRMGQTTFPELAASMGAVIPLASTLGSSQEELYGAFATLTGVTGSTAEVATQLRATYTDLLSPSKEMAAALKDMGYESGQAAIEAIGLNGTLQGLKESVDGDELAFANMFASVRSQTAVLALAGSQAENFTEKTLAMADAAGATDTAFGKMQATFSASVAKLTEVGNVIKTNLGQAALPSLSEAADAIAGLMSGEIDSAAFSEQFSGAIESLVDALDQVLPDLIEKGADILLAIVDGIMQALPKMVESGTKILTTLISKILEMLPSMLGAGMKAFAAFIQGIADALPTIIPKITEIIMTLVKTFLDNAPMIVEAGMELMKGFAQGILDALPVFIDMLPQIIDSYVNYITEAIPMVIETGIEIITALIDGIVEALPELVGMLPEVIQSIVEALLGQIDDIIQAGITLLTSLVDALPEIIETIVEVLPDIIEGIISALLDNIDDIIQAGVDLLVALVEALPKIIVTIVKAIPKIISGIIEALVNNIDKIILAGVQLFTALIEALPKIIIEIVKAIPQIIKALIEGFGGYIGKMGEIGLNLIKGIWQGIKDAGAWLRDKISGFFGGVVDSIKEFFGISSPSDLMEKDIGRWVPAGVAKGIDKYGGLVTDAMTRLGKNMVLGDFNPSIGTAGALSAAVPAAAQPQIISFDGIFRGAIFNVRSDEDIKLIARELYNMQQTTLRAGGY